MHVPRLDNAHLVISLGVTTRDHRGMYALYYFAQVARVRF